jgi:hypothetical protein
VKDSGENVVVVVEIFYVGLRISVFLFAYVEQIILSAG